MKKLIKYLLGLISFGSVAQSTPPQSNQMTSNIFDKAVKSDRNYKVEQVTDVPKIESKSEILSNSKLIYSKETKLWDNNLKVILDNPKYSESEKIEFIRAALEDDSRDAFEYINSRSIRFWSQSEEAKELIDSYFESKNYQESDELYHKYKYFEFKTKSLYPETYELITNYFENRPPKEKRYKYEGDLIYRLVQIGQNQDALRYLEILIAEFINDEIKYLPQIGSRNNQMYDGYVFDILCFSNEEDTKEKATNLLFHLLENKDFNTYELYQLTSYLDINRHIKLLEKRFDYYKMIDFSPIQDYETNDEIKRNRSKLVPEANAFYSFMFTNSLYLGKSKGKQVWKKFKETMPYWNIYGQPFEMSQMYILENCFQDTSLTQKEKINILKEVKLSNRLFSDRDYHGSYKARYLNLVVTTFPDKKIPKELFDELGIEGFIKYSNPLVISEEDLKPHPFRKKLESNQIDKIVSELNKYADASRLEPIELTDRNRFIYSLKTPESLIFDFFLKRNRMSWFDAESSSVPTDYKQFYTSEFKKVLEENSNLALNIASNIKQTEEGNYSYEVYVSSESKSYVYKYEEHGTDWYNAQRLVKMINLQLIDRKSKNRFVEVDSGDQTAIFILAEPIVLKKLLRNYNINCWAVNYGDEFHNR